MNTDIRNATIIANLLDNKFQIGGYRFGIDVLLDLIPVFGDTLILLLSLYIVYVGLKMKIPKTGIAHMLFNVIMSYLVGLIPILGEVAYFFFRPNIQNLMILKKYSDLH